MTTGEQGTDLNALLDATLAHVLATNPTFAAEKLEADRLLSHWRLYVDVFHRTYMGASRCCMTSSVARERSLRLLHLPDAVSFRYYEHRSTVLPYPVRKQKLSKNTQTDTSAVP
eukprot:5070199-Pleurochrysis_carterae.AAC.5